MPALLPSELPVLASTRHHWVVLLRRPHPVMLAALGVLALAAALQPDPGHKGVGRIDHFVRVDFRECHDRFLSYINMVS